MVAGRVVLVGERLLVVIEDIELPPESCWSIPIDLQNKALSESHLRMKGIEVQEIAEIGF